MKPSPRPLGIVAATAAAAILPLMVLVHPIGAASSPQSPMAHTHDHGAAPAMGPIVPIMPGQDAFGAIQEIVRLLETDPGTDWSRVNLEALRQHLIDMNKVTLEAAAAETPIEAGLEIVVTGEGRTLDAIRRMVPAHAQELDRMNGWTASAETLPNGVLLTVTSDEPGQAAHIRGLGFIGLLVSGGHHQPHHLAIAKGEPVHAH